MKKILAVLLFLLPVLCFSQHQNIRIDNPATTNSVSEPSIMINPHNTSQIMAGSNLDYFYVSEDGGYTWTSNTLYSAENGVWGDPCLIADTNGDFYFMHLSNPPSGNWIDRIVCQKTTNMGQSWDVESYAGLQGAKAQDKEWATVDRTNNNIYMTWTQFDDYGSSSSSDSSKIMFAKSINAGESWSEAIQINQVSGNCIDSDETVEGAVPCVGPEGQIYVSWSGPAGMVFDRSYDQGETWLENDIFIDEQPGGWDMDIPGINRCNGMPVTVCDTSMGAYHGTIYVNWADQRNGEDDTDIWLSKSTDQGDTWSDPVRVNDDEPGSHQFFTWMTIDQTTGNLFLVFYDRRNYLGLNTDVFMAMSTDGGESFVNFQLNDDPFVPSDYLFFGDYTNIAAHDGVVRPIWVEMDNDQTSLYTAIVDLSVVGLEDVYRPVAYAHAYPNPFHAGISLAYETESSEPVTISLFSVSGKRIVDFIDHDRIGPGEHNLQFNTDLLGLSNGVYYLRILQGSAIEIKKLVYEE